MLPLAYDLPSETDPSYAAPSGKFDDILGFSLRLAQGVAYRHFTQVFKSLRLTQTQVSVLWLIEDYPGVGQANIAKRLQIDRATVMAIVNRLVRLRYVAKTDSDTDGRKQVLTLLPAGVTGLMNAKQMLDLHEQWLRCRLSRQQVTTLFSLLHCIHGYRGAVINFGRPDPRIVGRHHHRHGCEALDGGGNAQQREGVHQKLARL